MLREYVNPTIGGTYHERGGIEMIYQIDAQILPQVRLAGMAIIKPPYVHTRRKSGEYILYLILKGTMYLEEGNRQLSLQPGDVCILDPELIHAGRKASWCQYYYVHFKHENMSLVAESCMEGLKAQLLRLRRQSVQSDQFTYDSCHGQYLYFPKFFHIANESDLMHISGLLNAAMECNEMQLEHYKTLLACKIMEIMIKIGRSYVSAENFHDLEPQPRSYYKIRQLADFLNQEYARDITSAMLEKEFNSNFDYLNRIFKKVNGKTIFRYLSEIRVNHAKALLLKTPWKISKIGAAVGFPDEYYFSRVFKKYTGKPPSEYAREGLNLK